MSKSDPWGEGGTAGAICLLSGQAVWRYERGMALVSVLAAAGKRAGTTWSPARVQHEAPSFCCSCWAADVFSALWLGHEERAMFSVTTHSSLSLPCSFGKLVLFARQPLVSSLVVPQTGICGHLRWDDWIWEEDQIEKQTVCQNDRMSALDIQTSCLMHIWFKLHKICSIYQGKTMTYDSSLPDRMGFSVYIPAQLKW